VRLRGRKVEPWADGEGGLGVKQLQPDVKFDFPDINARVPLASVYLVVAQVKATGCSGPKTAMGFGEVLEQDNT
jgi:hypothetical protein